MGVKYGNSDNFSIFCRHQYSIFQVHMRKVRWGDFITLLYCPYHTKAKGSTVHGSQIFSLCATRIYYYYFPRKITSLSHASLRWERHFLAFQASPIIVKKQQVSAKSIASISQSLIVMLCKLKSSAVKVLLVIRTSQNMELREMSPHHNFLMHAFEK